MSPSDVPDAPDAPDAHDAPRRLPAHFVLWVRAGVGAAMAVLVFSGDRHFDYYPTASKALVMVAAAYAWLVVPLVIRWPSSRPLPAWFPWLLVVFDTSCIVAAAGFSGGGDSPMAPVLLLVVIAIAIRYGFRRALLALAWTLPALTAVILLVPEPARPGGDRLREAAWWSLYLTAAVVLAGVLSDRLSVALERRAEAEARARLERRRVELEHDLRRRTEAMGEARREFLAALLHDFRPSVSSMHTLARALGRDGETLPPGEEKRFLARLEGYAGDLDALLNEVSEELLRDAGATLRADAVDVYLPQLVATAVARSPLFPDRLIVEIDPDAGVVRTDPGKCQRILANLIDEAARRSSPGNPVSVCVRRQNGAVEISVSDQGGAERAEGAAPGLGLWIAARLAEAMEGGMEAVALPDGGQRVRVWIGAA